MRYAHPSRDAVLVGAVAAALASGNPLVILLAGILVGVFLTRDDNHPGGRLVAA